MSDNSSSLQVTVSDGNRRFDFHSTSAFSTYLSFTAPAQSSQMLRPYFNEFVKFPQVDEILVTYFDEITKSTDNNLRLAPSILIGAISELLILRLLDVIGKLLEDPNTLSNYRNRHRTPERRMQYTRTMVENGRARLVQDGHLPADREHFFADFDNIVPQVFEAIRLRRNDYVHPKPNMSLDDLPTVDVVSANVHAFNPYARVILSLIDTFVNATPQV